MRLSSLLGKDNPLRAEIQDAENAFFADPENPLFNWDKETVRTALLQAGINANCDHFHITEAKRITEIVELAEKKQKPKQFGGKKNSI